MFGSEAEFVKWLKTIVPKGGSRLRVGIGDDAALVRVPGGQEIILTTDLSIEGVHFLRRLHPPRAVGHRALARALSDIAAMGGTPRFALISLAISRGTSRRWIEALYQGMSALAQRFGVSIIGGDTAVVSGHTVIDLVLAGEVAPQHALLRSGARPGDQLFVSGRLGMSALGLSLLNSPPGRAVRERTQAIRAHLYPEPQCAFGRFLAQKRLASALIDVSDGLSTDLAHLCEASGVGARVWAERIPKPEVSNPADSLHLALHGGEDYQLLFTVAPQKIAYVPSRFRNLSLHWMGEITRSRKILLVQADGRQEPLLAAGYDHFRNK